MKLFKKIVSLVLVACLMSACSVVEELQDKLTKKEEKVVDEKVVEEKEEKEDLQDILTKHVWINDFQSLKLFEFEASGDIYRSYWAGKGDMPIYDMDNKIKKSMEINRESWSEKEHFGRYTVNKDQVEISFEDGSLVKCELEHSVKVAEYLDRYRGDYFLFEVDYKDSGELDSSPFYVYGLTVDKKASNVSNKAKDNYLGYYVYDENTGIQEILRVDSIVDDAIIGKYLFATAQEGEYGCRDFVWNIEQSEPLVGKELFQDLMDYIYYTFDDGILVTYPEGYSIGHKFKYVCGLENPESKIKHPFLNLMLETPEEKPGAFYGIWTLASQDINECLNEVDALQQMGFNADVYLTTEWSNLNAEPWYVVSAGEFSSEQEANDMLGQVQAAERPTAYVKYTGDHY